MDFKGRYIIHSMRYLCDLCHSLPILFTLVYFKEGIVEKSKRWLGNMMH